MSQVTLGEECFEKFCSERGIIAARIPETSVRTPDYDLFFGENKVLVEVKDIGLSPDEERARAALMRGETVVLSETVNVG